MFSRRLVSSYCLCSAFMYLCPYIFNIRTNIPITQSQAFRPSAPGRSASPVIRRAQFSVERQAQFRAQASLFYGITSLKISFFSISILKRLKPSIIKSFFQRSLDSFPTKTIRNPTGLADFVFLIH